MYTKRKERKDFLKRNARKKEPKMKRARETVLLSHGPRTCAD